jgi:hypothetical protein
MLMLLRLLSLAQQHDSTVDRALIHDASFTAVPAKSIVRGSISWYCEACHSMSYTSVRQTLGNFDRKQKRRYAEPWHLRMRDMGKHLYMLWPVSEGALPADANILSRRRPSDPRPLGRLRFRHRVQITVRCHPYGARDCRHEVSQYSWPPSGENGS